VSDPHVTETSIGLEGHGWRRRGCGGSPKSDLDYGKEHRLYIARNVTRPRETDLGKGATAAMSNNPNAREAALKSGPKRGKEWSSGGCPGKLGTPSKTCGGTKRLSFHLTARLDPWRTDEVI